MPPPSKVGVRPQWIVNVFVALLWWLVGGSTEMESVAQPLIGGRWQWLLPSVLVEGMYFAVNCRRTFACVGVECVLWTFCLFC